MKNLQLDAIVEMALAEDLGTGDLTCQSVIPTEARARAAFEAREPGVFFGLEVARRVFEMVDADLVFEALVQDGATVQAGDHVAVVRGSARSILSAERTALNFVQRLSGVATASRRAHEALGESRTRILDTRKTTPGMRSLEKQAVRAGGSRNHRSGLFDAVMIKNNHLKFCAPAEAIRRARAHAPVTACVEIEVESLEQLREALEAGPDVIMLDNMPVERMREALAIVGGRARVEISGGVKLHDLTTLRDVGVDYISMGALTHSARAMDFSLRVEPLD